MRVLKYVYIPLNKRNGFSVELFLFQEHKSPFQIGKKIIFTNARLKLA